MDELEENGKTVRVTYEQVVDDDATVFVGVKMTPTADAHQDLDRILRRVMQELAKELGDEG